MSGHATRYWIPVNSASLRKAFSREMLWNYFSETGELVADHQREALHPPDALALYATPFSFSPAASDPGFLLLDATSLAECSMCEVDDGLLYYYQPVHFRIGNFQLRMLDDEFVRRIDADCAIFLEAKTFGRYVRAKFIRKGEEHPVVRAYAGKFEAVDPRHHRLSNAPCAEYIPGLQPKLVQYDVLKGFLYGWSVGQHGEPDPGSGRLEALLLDIRNKLTGLRTGFELTHLRNEKQERSVIALFQRAERMVSAPS